MPDKWTDEQILEALPRYSRSGAMFEERDKLIVRQWLEQRMRLKDIARAHDISVPRVRQIIARIRNFLQKPKAPPPRPEPRQAPGSIWEAEWSVRAATVFKREGIETMQQLIDLLDTEPGTILGWQNVGQRTMREIREVVWAYCEYHRAQEPSAE
jgi:DNA-directed RNA polymerase alpha subunit